MFVGENVRRHVLWVRDGELCDSPARDTRTLRSHPFIRFDGSAGWPLARDVTVSGTPVDVRHLRRRRTGHAAQFSSKDRARAHVV